MNVRTPARDAAIDVSEHRMLALEVRVLDVVPSRDEIREPLDDDRLRRDRVAADRAARARASPHTPLPRWRSAPRARAAASRLTPSPPPSRSRSGRDRRPRRCRSPCSRGSRSTIEPSLRAIAPSGQKSAHRAQAVQASVSTGRSSDHVPGVVAAGVGRAHREEGRAPAEASCRRSRRQLDRRIACERVLSRAPRVALSGGERCSRRPAAPMRDAIASSRKREPVRERAASRTRRARPRSPSAGPPRRGCRGRARCARPGRARCRTARVREARLAVQDDQPAGPDGAEQPAATAARERRRRARRTPAPCSGGGSATSRPSAGRPRSARRAARP